jgi:hypothetical protein
MAVCKGLIARQRAKAKVFSAFSEKPFKCGSGHRARIFI